MKTKSHSLRRKAHSLHRKADALLRARKVFDAATVRERARNLEARADVLDEADEDTQYSDLAAGFDDGDLPCVATVQLTGRRWF